MTDPSDLLSTSEAAVYTGRSTKRLLKLANDGRLGQRVGYHYVFTRAELDAYRTNPPERGGRGNKGKPIVVRRRRAGSK